HLAGDLAVAAAHTIARAAHLDAERRHDELLVRVVRPGAAEVEESLQVESRLVRVVAGDLDHPADAGPLVAGTHRRVGGEHGLLARGGECLVARATECHLASGPLAG